MNILSRFACFIATLGPIGYLPAQGTWATLATLPLVYALSQWLSPAYTTHDAFIRYAACYGLILAALGWLAQRVIPIACAYFGSDDPPQVVIDELVGTLITFYAIEWTIGSAIAGFLLFRFFDIFKPLGIRSIEKIPTYGVLLDDVLAGIYSYLILLPLSRLLS